MESAADEIFRVVPQGYLPAGRRVVAVCGDHSIAYLIEEDTPLTDVVAELNRLATHVVRHGLWIPQPEQRTPPRLRHAS